VVVDRGGGVNKMPSIRPSIHPTQDRGHCCLLLGRNQTSVRWGTGQILWVHASSGGKLSESRTAHRFENRACARVPVVQKERRRCQLPRSGPSLCRVLSRRVASVPPFVRPSVHSFVRSFARSLVRSLVRSFRPSVRSFPAVRCELTVKESSRLISGH